MKLSAAVWRSWLCLLVAGYPVAISQAVIGYEGSDTVITVPEMGPTEEICVESQTVNSGDEIIVVIAYEGRIARVGTDFENTPVSLSFTSSGQTLCFNYTIIDDDEYELREDFFINLTSTSKVSLMPYHRIIMIIDDDGLQISWERQEYTVREEEGSLEVCAWLNGTHSTDIPVVNVLLVGGTATEGVDYRRLQEVLAFDIGGATRHCYTIQLITDIAYEGTKEFQAQLLTIDTDRVEVFPFAKIVLLDYNVIIQQQPQSVREGLENLFDNTLINGFECEVPNSNETEYESVACSSTTLLFTLSPLPLDRAISVLIHEDNTTLLNDTLLSMSDPQALNYTTLDGNTQLLNISVQVVNSNGSDYYLVMLESSFGLHFQMTAIPLILVDNPQVTGSTNGVNNDASTLFAGHRRRLTLMIIGGVIGATILVTIIL